MCADEEEFLGWEVRDECEDCPGQESWDFLDSFFHPAWLLKSGISYQASLFLFLFIKTWWSRDMMNSSVLSGSTVSPASLACIYCELSLRSWKHKYFHLMLALVVWISEKVLSDFVWLVTSTGLTSLWVNWRPSCSLAQRPVRKTSSRLIRGVLQILTSSAK